MTSDAIRVYILWVVVLRMTTSKLLFTPCRIVLSGFNLCILSYAFPPTCPWIFVFFFLIISFVLYFLFLFILYLKKCIFEYLISIYLVIFILFTYLSIFEYVHYYYFWFSNYDFLTNLLIFFSGLILLLLLWGRKIGSHQYILL